MAQDTKIITLSLGSLFFIMIVLALVGILGGYAGSKFAQPRQLQQVQNGTNTIVPVSQTVTISPSKNAADIVASKSKSVLLLAHKNAKGVIPFSMGIIVTSDGVVLSPLDGGTEPVIAIGENGDETPLVHIGKDSLTNMHFFRMENKVVVPVELAQKAPKIGASLLAIARSEDTMQPNAESVTLSRIIPPAPTSLLGIEQVAIIQPSLSNKLTGSPMFDDEGRLAGIMRTADNAALLVPDIQQAINRLSSHSLANDHFAELGFTTTWKIQNDPQAGHSMRAIVASVASQGIADRAGLKIGDTISAINGNAITWDSKIHEMLAEKQTLLTVLRQGESKTVTLIQQQ